ncbi:Bch2 protein [Saccharomycopsis crataegensis]|uniref:Bch2 protein n=1 Tax=Saccharomycopsis crataegensis TaxID=43959 RepID=A0AAV5QMN0_9ASCO|nr:Bch2 protein [Saccharomycopsis crataegensis]
MFRSKKKKDEIKSSSNHIEAPQSFASKQYHKKNNKVSGSPFIFEKNFGEAITKRTELMAHNSRSLGPADLLHISTHHNSKDQGQFHYVTGLDLSSVAAPVAYLTKMIYNNKFSGESSSSSNLNSIGTYCAWNCFSKCDVRIRTEFPGQKTSVQLVAINGKPFNIRANVGTPKHNKSNSVVSSNSNNPHKGTDSSEMYESSLNFKLPSNNKGVFEGIPEEIWQQTYVSGIMRNILFSDNLEAYKPSLVQNTLISTKSAAKKIIELIVRMLPKGFLTGASELNQGADFIHNYLIDTLLKILKISDLYKYTISLIEPLVEINFNYHMVLVQLLIEERSDELRLIKELKRGVVFYNDAANKNFGGKNYGDFYLLAQSRLMAEKQQLDSALYLAIKAIEKNPTEFLNWTNLLETYITQKDVHNALLTLNSCPVYSIPTAKTVQRIKEENSLFDQQEGNYKFPEPSQEGYLEQVWSQANRQGPVYLRDKDTILSEDFASESELATVDPILLRLSGPKLKGTFKAAYDYLSGLAILVGWDALLKIRTEVFVMEGEFQSVKETKTAEAKDHEEKSGKLSTASTTKPADPTFRTKRLCERWLDSLFFMLYDDLKVLSIWENKAQRSGNALSHSTLEWELIGITAFRAKHYDLAVSALRTSLKAKFSIITAKNLFEIFEQFFGDYQSFKRLSVNFADNKYAKELVFVGSNNIIFPNKREFIVDTSQIGNIPINDQLMLINEQSLENNLYLDLVLEVLIKIFSWNYRWYEDFSIDCLILLKKILNENERDLIVNKLRASFESQGHAVKLFERYISWIQMFDEN